MILFLSAPIINRSKILIFIYEELKKRQEDNLLEIINISVHSAITIRQYIQQADVIVFDSSLVLSMGKTVLLSRNVALDKNVPKDYFFEVWDLIDKSGKPVFFLHPASDLHAVNFGLEREFYLSLLKRITGIFWPYHQCPFDRDSRNDRYPFSTLKPYNLTKTDVINIWDEIKSHVPISIDFARGLSIKEMNTRSKKKYWESIIPGVTYVTRKIAYESAVKSNLKIAPYVRNSRWLVVAPYLLYNKVMPDKQSAKIYQYQSMWLYREMISRSAVSFACGSELRYFVRKFLEIPAFRSAMIAYPSYNFHHYGFKDGVNCLEAYPEEFGEKASYLLKNRSFADKLVQNAWDLVAKEHTAAVKVDQVLKCLNLFQQGKLKSAGYQDGKFEIVS